MYLRRSGLFTSQASDAGHGADLPNRAAMRATIFKTKNQIRSRKMVA
jgi:hypothetical protein